MLEIIGQPTESPDSITELNAVERTAVEVLGRIPGLGGLSPSRRVLKAMRGGTWTMAGYGASQLLKLASTLTLARMLAPQAFGLIALVNVFLSGLEMLSDLGIGMDVVQHPRGDDPAFINTAFLIQMARGVLLWAVATALAYPFARFYRQPAVLTLLLVSAVTVLLRGLTSGSLWGLTRHVQLGKYNAISVGTELFGFIVSLVWALMSPTAWALVVGRIAATVALIIVSHSIADYPFSLRWDALAAKDILAFGSGIAVGTGTYFLSGEAERLVVGKFVNLVELGCFSIAVSISAAASRGIQQIINQVFFPMMSDSLREDRKKAILHFRKTRYLVCLLCSILACGFILFSDWFVKVALGPKYAMAGWMLQLLGVRAALELFTLLSVSMLFALGTSRYGAIGNIFKLVVLAVGFTIAFGHFGFREALWVLTIAPLATYVPFLYGMHKYCKEILPVELASFFIFLAVTVSTGVLLVLFHRA